MRVRREAETDAARIRCEAESHARRLILDARATADGVRAEGMELVSNLRQMGDALHSNAERLLHDIQAIHARMIGQLEQASPQKPTLHQPPAAPAEAAPSPGAGPDEVLDVPDFVARR